MSGYTPFGYININSVVQGPAGYGFATDEYGNYDMQNNNIVNGDDISSTSITTVDINSDNITTDTIDADSMTASSIITDTITITNLATPIYTGAAVHLQSAGSSIICIDADTDNVDETDLPRLVMTQDGRAGYGEIALSNSDGMIFNNGTSTNSTSGMFTFYGCQMVRNLAGVSYATSASPYLKLTNSETTIYKDLVLNNDLTINNIVESPTDTYLLSMGSVGGTVNLIPTSTFDLPQALGTTDDPEFNNLTVDTIDASDYAISGLVDESMNYCIRNSSGIIRVKELGINVTLLKAFSLAADTNTLITDFDSRVTGGMGGTSLPGGTFTAPYTGLYTMSVKIDYTTGFGIFGLLKIVSGDDLLTFHIVDNILSNGGIKTGTIFLTASDVCELRLLSSGATASGDLEWKITLTG